MAARSMTIPRICLTGVESTGKTTLAPRLAAHFGGVVMPEFGRTHAELFGTDFTPDDLIAIALGHRAALAAIEATSPKLIIEDTDIVTTAAWARMLHGPCGVLRKIPATAGLHLLFAPDVPFVPDGTRLFGGDERARFHQMLEAELHERRITPIHIGGDFASRQATAIHAIENWLLRTAPPAP